jgi:hypothetical protein
MKKVLFIILLFLAGLAMAYPQESTSNSEVKVPTLNGHTFPSVVYHRSSFINTNLEANLGFGLTSRIRIQGLMLGEEELFSFQGQIMFIHTRVQYQQRFNKWLALYFSGSFAGRIGTSISTLIADGVNTVVGGDIGWMIRIYQSRKFNLSTAIYLETFTGNFINITQYFQEVIDTVAEPKVTKKVPAMLAGLSVQGAYAISRGFGLQFQAGMVYGESFQREESSASFTVGILADYDFMPVQKVPVGLALGYILTSSSEVVLKESGSANLFTGRISYTGSDDFELGLQYTYNVLTIENINDDPSLNTLMLMLKFYF